MEVKRFIYYDILEYTRDRDRLCQLLIEYGIFASEIVIIDFYFKYLDLPKSCSLS